ncbi:MAG: hypothetical protein K2M91_08340 [Lachnospiraceae bacterium]|nr:hypothetical protein [Lachnospiraceae bacterium]
MLTIMLYLEQRFAKEKDKLNSIQGRLAIALRYMSQMLQGWNHCSRCPLVKISDWSGRMQAKKKKVMEHILAHKQDKIIIMVTHHEHLFPYADIVYRLGV